MEEVQDCNDFEMALVKDESETVLPVSGTAVESEKLLKEVKKAESPKFSRGRIYFNLYDMSKLYCPFSSQKLNCKNLFTFVSTLACITASRVGIKTNELLQQHIYIFIFWM